MRKKENFILIIILGFILLGLIAGLSRYLVHKYTSGAKQDEQKVQQSAVSPAHDVEDMTDVNTSADNVTETTEVNEPADNVLETFGLKLELLDYHVVDNLEEYPMDPDYCNPAYYPEDGKDSINEQWIDREKVFAEAPELKEIYMHPENYTAEEREEIYSRTHQVELKYTEEKMVPYDYVIVTCRMTNTMVDEDGNDTIQEVYMESQNMIFTYEYGWTMGKLLYFDKAQHTQASEEPDSLYFYEMEPGETLEYVLAFAIEEETLISTNRMCFGIPVIMETVNEVTLNPSDVSDCMWDLEEDKWKKR